MVGRKKKVHKSASVIHSSDPPFPEPTSGDDTESTTGALNSDSQETETPKTTASKRKRHSPMTPKGSQKFTYILAILTATEVKKAVAKHCPKIATMHLNRDEPWDTVKAQILTKISQALNPPMLDYSKYSVMFYISQHFPKPGASLHDEDNYFFLKECATGKDTTINIVIMEKGSEDKENKANSDAEGHSTKTKGKKKNPALLEGNVHCNQNMQLLREQWVCQEKQQDCLGGHCYIDPDGNHLPLSHECLECWASAMQKGDTVATLHSPPNHKLFDSTNTLSPVLQQRLKANKSNAPTVPVINLTIGNELANLFGNKTDQTTSATTTSNLLSPTLLPPTRLPGTDMPLAEFCTKYSLSESVLQKFHENAYKDAQMLRFITIIELKEMGFCLGEIAGLRDAVESWSHKIAN